jgi:hypothetical protein
VSELEDTNDSSYRKYQLRSRVRRHSVLFTVAKLRKGHLVAVFFWCVEAAYRMLLPA